MQIELPELIFKIMSICLLPTLFWINSISVDVALLKKQVSLQNVQITSLQAEQKAIHDGVKDNQSSLKTLTVTMGFIKEVLDEIKEELKK